MRAPIRVTARPYTFPVATGGWNARDALDAMKPDEAETLINWFPETTYNRLRRGYAVHSDTGEVGSVLAMTNWSDGATENLIAYVGVSGLAGEWWDVTTSTPAVLTATAFDSTEWDTMQFRTAGAHYVLATDGKADPYVYDGSTMVVTVNTIGGSAPSIVFNRIGAYNQRIYYAEDESLTLWYLPVGQYQGALTEYDLGPLCQKGGKIAKIATWTRDNASAGANEMFVVVTTEGEVLVFIGDYPGGTWQLSARFAVGQPVAGPNCVVRLGPDMILLCQDGFQPMAHYLQLGESQAQAVALSSKIGNAVTAAVNTAKDTAGWMGLLYPAGNMVIFNVPTATAGTFVQYVVNTLTGAWCQWQGQNAYCWALLGTAPYFGGDDGIVYRADSGTSDNGQTITAEYRGSYQYIGGQGLIKRAIMAQPVFQTNGAVNVTFGIDVDFNNTSLTSPIPSVASGSVWGSFVWGLGTWGSGLTLQRNWISVTGLGYAMAPHFVVTSNSITVNLMNITLTYEKGSFI
jgi:hypothetical protein